MNHRARNVLIAISTAAVAPGCASPPGGGAIQATATAGLARRTGQVTPTHTA